MQSYLLYKTKDKILARGRATGEIILQSENAASVIQDTLDILESQGGGELLIECGTYLVDTPLNLPDMVSVRGIGRATVLKLDHANADGTIFYAEGKQSVRIADLTCQGLPAASRGTGILFDECGDCEISGVHARDFREYGFLLRNNCFMNRLQNNTTSGNGLAGTLVKDTKSGRGGDWTPNLIIGCTSIGEEGHGFELSFAICTNIVGCQVYQPTGHGFYIHSESNSTCLSGSRVYQGSQNGILVENSHELNVSSNIVCWNKGHGIELNYVVWGTVSANNFIDNGGRTQQRYGIYIHTDTHSVQVTANAIFNWEGHKPMLGGIFEALDCSHNQISHNTINYYTDDAVTSLGRESISTHNLGVPEKYVHPGPQPFPTQGLLYTQDEFSREKVLEFLALTRR
jgi:parallel beta-helix repeat protein